MVNKIMKNATQIKYENMVMWTVFSFLLFICVKWWLAEIRYSKSELEHLLFQAFFKFYETHAQFNQSGWYFCWSELTNVTSKIFPYLVDLSFQCLPDSDGLASKVDRGSELLQLNGINILVQLQFLKVYQGGKNKHYCWVIVSISI